MTASVIMICIGVAALPIQWRNYRGKPLGRGAVIVAALALAVATVHAAGRGGHL